MMLKQNKASAVLVRVYLFLEAKAEASAVKGSVYPVYEAKAKCPVVLIYLFNGAKAESKAKQSLRLKALHRLSWLGSLCLLCRSAGMALRTLTVGCLIPTVGCLDLSG